MTTLTATTSVAISNDNFLRASFDGTTARNSHSSHSARSHHKNVHNSSRWRPATARSAQTIAGTRRRSPSPLLNRFGRVSRQRQNGACSNSATRSRSSGGISTGGGSMRARTSNGCKRRSSYSNNSRHGSLSGGTPPPPLTREEYEALPVAIQRKYFSTLERLRFAQSSSQVDGIYQHYDAISAQNIHRRRPRQDRVASDSIATRLRKRSLRESPSIIGASVADKYFYANLPDKIKKREFTREEQVLLAGQLRASVILDAADEAIYKIGRRSSINRRLITPDITVDSPTTASFRHSMETIQSSEPRHARRDALGLDLGSSSISAKRMSGVPESFYDSFRWLEEEDDLDLRLFLDDYHSNLRDQLPSPTAERGPSFRRHLSISKMPFGRPPQTTTPAMTSSQLVTKDDASIMTTTSPSSGSGVSGGKVPFPNLPTSASNSSNASLPPLTHVRRKSRTLSLISPRHHASQASISTIDPGAAHYQDPEARLKLRVYLASPQKFDEAIEFGFPSTDVLSSVGSPPIGSSTLAPSVGAVPSTTAAKRHRDARQSTSNGSNNLRSFLADDDDDDDKLDSDQGSIPDPESPKTPQLMPEVSAGAVGSVSGPGGKPTVFRPYRLSTEPTLGHRPSDSYAQVPANSREMTLRMTLTRLDLRAGEDQIYGWQQQQQQQPYHHQNHQPQPSLSGRKSTSTQNYYSPKGGDDGFSTGAASKTATPLVSGAVTYVGPNGSRPKESIENVFAGIDHWEAAEQEKGVMKRFWNRVRRS